MSDPRVLLANSPMSLFQWAAVLTTFAMSALDGFDVLAVTLVAPSLVHQWHVNPAALGLVFSVGLVGMAFGSFVVAPLGDIAGRRTLARVALVVMTVGMFLSVRANGVAMLALYRLITGIGIGAVVAIINPLAAEYANIRRRELAIGLMAIGFPLGGVLGGLSAAYLLTHGGWRAVFMVGGVFGLGLTAASLVLLPEPIAFLVEKQGPRALAHVNRFLRHCGHAAVESLPPRAEAKAVIRPFEIFHVDHLRSTLHMSAILFLFVVTVYFFLSWIPLMVTAAGFTPSMAARVAVMANVSGAIGGSLIGWAAGRFPLKPLSFTAVLGMGIGAIVFGYAGGQLVALTVTAALGGFFAHSGMVSMHSLIARTFPSHMRASGAGFALGMGRIGSALAPAVAGYLFNTGMSRGQVSVVMGSSAVLAALLLLTFHVNSRALVANPSTSEDLGAIAPAL